jgi:fatty acid desaturase
MYALEAVGAVASLLPARAIAAIERRLEGDDTVAHLVVRALRQGRALTEVRIDTAIVLALLAGAIVLYGAHWWMLAAALAGRAFLVSFADNSYHYATKLDAPREAKNVRAPRWLELALLNFPLHGVHHVHPALPWRALRARFEADGGRYDEGYFACLARQLRGPIEVGELEGR